MYDTGFKVETAKRLKFVDVGIPTGKCSDNGPFAINRRYELSYEKSPVTGRDRLAAVMLLDKDLRSEVAPVRVTYQGDVGLSMTPWSGGPTWTHRRNALLGILTATERPTLRAIRARESSGPSFLSDGTKWRDPSGAWSGQGPHVDFPITRQCVTGDLTAMEKRILPATRVMRD